jgi:Flp pilus assembly protein TadD
MANLLASLDRGDEAIAVLTRALEIAPRMGELSIQLGFIHHQRGDDAKARELIARGIPLAAPDPDALFMLARLTQNECNFAGAAELYKRLLALTPNDAAARIGLGACLLELKQDEAALREIGAAASTGEKMFGESLSALVSSGRGRFWLRPSLAAKALKKT